MALLRWVPLVCLVVLNACSPVQPPEKPNVAEPPAAKMEEAAGEPAPPRETPLAGEAFWQDRAAQWEAHFRESFVPPPEGHPTTIELAGGQPKTGVLVSRDDEGVVLGLEGGAVTYPRVSLSPRSRAQFFVADFARARARLEVQKEQEEYGALLQPDELAALADLVPVGDAPEAPAAEATPEEKPRFRIRPARERPRNSEDDGSVWQVREYIRHNVRNPASVRYVKWYPVQQYENGYFVRCKYFTDGGSFGTFLEDKVFFMNGRGDVVRTSAGTGSLAP
jgi:hypothetical protein